MATSTSPEKELLEAVRKRLLKLLDEPEVLKSKRLYHMIRMAYTRSDPEGK